MAVLRRTPSGWLLYNSNGYPDFLFTILTYSMLLLIFVSVFWIGFGILAFLNADNAAKAKTILSVMDSMKTGLISLAGVVFGLAGSYTVRRFKKDEHYLKKQEVEKEMKVTDTESTLSKLLQPGLKVVHNEEDI
ncbi:MAG: hypothetical protein ACE5NG_17410 [bacterium]